MAFAISVANLIETMKRPGCPVCALQRAAARKSVDVFLWENMMDPQVRASAVQAGGFCPPHTRLFAAVELGSTGRPLGVNILYDTVSRQTAARLRRWHPPSRVPTWLSRLLPAAAVPAPPPCPLCATEAQSALNTLSTLFEELDRETPDLTSAYLTSDGLCRAHLDQGLEIFGRSHPAAARFLAGHTAQKLEQQAALMQEMIRKQNWEYRDEILTPAEAEAWRQALTFFTGYPGRRFTFKIDEDQP